MAAEPDKDKPIFGAIEEEAIISLAIDFPEFFSVVGKWLGPEVFERAECKFVMLILQDYISKDQSIPPRDILTEHAIRQLTVDHDYEPVLKILERKSDPREVDHIKNRLMEWARDKAYGLLFSERALDAYENRNYTELQDIVEKAQRITDIGDSGLWLFDNYEVIFSEDAQERMTCGFQEMDSYINEGGPARKEVFVWMAPTGVGKSVLLVHSGLMNVKAGKKVLHVTLEMSKLKTAERYMGAVTDIRIKDKMFKRQQVEDALRKFRRSYDGDLVIFEQPADEISVDEIHQYIHFMRRTKNWTPDIIIIDYLELMLSRRNAYNDKDYTRQKSISTEIRGLATKENVLVFTATQTNREGMTKAHEGEGAIDLNKISESYGKAMPIDYCVSINQSPQEYNNKPLPRARLYIAKNRNGPKQKTVSISMNYETMRVREEIIGKI